jgi:hypothetical protein
LRAEVFETRTVWELCGHVRLLAVVPARLPVAPRVTDKVILPMLLLKTEKLVDDP